jgi:endonuclease-3
VTRVRGTAGPIAAHRRRPEHPRTPRRSGIARPGPAASYGSWRRPAQDPLSELIFTILSQHTSDTNRDRAWDSMWRAFRSWEEVARAPRERLEEAIRTGGLARTKSGVIQQVLAQVQASEGAYTLDRLRGLGMQEVEEALLSLPGVGLKTVRCVQVFSLGQPAFPVDTHIHRITRRLGLVPLKATPAAVHAAMADLTPPGETLPFHINLITHGRRVCKAGRPLCEACVLRPECRHGTRAGRRGRKSPVKRL